MHLRDWLDRANNRLQRFRGNPKLEELSKYISLASAAQPAFTLSAGIVQTIERDDVTSVLKRAEMALDAADRGGGNRVHCHDGERVMPSNALLEMEMMA
jgi:PleD family two-component response regulator